MFKTLLVVLLLIGMAGAANCHKWHNCTPPPPATGSFTDSFNTGSLDSNWVASSGNWPGSFNTMSPTSLDFSQGMLRIRLTQTSSGSVGGEIHTVNALGYGTYEWIMRAGSTSATATGYGSPISGQVSAGFQYINNSQNEIDFEIEGQHPDTLWLTNWTYSNNISSSVQINAPEAGFHSYKYVWTAGKVVFYYDGVLVGTHTTYVSSAPAYAMINFWGTNGTGWGGLATPGVTRYMYVKQFTYTAL